MKFDVSRFKKIKATEKETQLLHPHGHVITLNHDKLQPGMKKVLEALPMAEGGEVPEMSQEPTRAPAGEDPNVIKVKKMPEKGFLDIPMEKLIERAKKAATPHKYENAIRKAAEIAGIDPYAFKILGTQENLFSPEGEKAIGYSKYIKPGTEAKGYMQLRPKALIDIHHYGYDVKDPLQGEQNIIGAGHYLKALKSQLTKMDPQRYKDGVPLEDLFGAYNLGANAYYKATYANKKLSKGEQAHYSVYVPAAIGAYNYGIANNLNRKPMGEVEEKAFTEVPTPLKAFGQGEQAKAQAAKPQAQQAPKAGSQNPMQDFRAWQQGQEAQGDQVMQQVEGNQSSMQPWEQQGKPEARSSMLYGKAEQYGPEGTPAQAPLENVPYSSHYGPGETAQQFLQQPTPNPLHATSIPAAEYWSGEKHGPDIEGLKTGNIVPPGTMREPNPVPNTPIGQIQAAGQEATRQAQQKFPAQEPAQAQAPAAMAFNQTPGLTPSGPEKAQQQGAQAGISGTEDRFGYGALKREMEEARAQGLQGAMMPGQAYEQYAKDTNALLAQKQKEYKALWDRSNKYRQDYQNEVKNAAAKIQKVDATRWLHNNMGSTGQKIATAIGLLFSGIGSGITGQPNMAMKWINDQIDRDIESQKTNINAQENLLRIYNDHFRNMTDAEQMTRAVMQEYYASMIENHANTLASKVKQAEGMKAAAEFRMKAASEIQSIAQRGAMMDYTMGVMGGINGQSPEGKVRALEMVGMVPKERADKMYKDIQEYRSNVSKIQEMESAYKELARLSYTTAKISEPKQSKNKIEMLRAQLLGPLSRELAGKFSEFEAKNLEEALPKYTDDDKTVNFKVRKFMKMLENIYNMPGFAPNYPEMNAYGIQLNPYIQQPMRKSAPSGYMGK